MTILEYMAKFTELACFANDYVATDMTKVMKFEDGLKLSIQGKIVGLFVQDMDFMVRTTMVIERDIDDARASGMRVLVEIERRTSFLLARERNEGLLFHEDLQDRAAAIRAKARIN